MQQRVNDNFQRGNGNQRRARMQRRRNRRRKLQQRRRQNMRRQNRLRQERLQQQRRNGMQGNLNPSVQNNMNGQNIQNGQLNQNGRQRLRNQQNAAMPQKPMIDLLQPSFPLNHMLPQPKMIPSFQQNQNMAVQPLRQPGIPNQQAIPQARNNIQQGFQMLPQNIPNNFKAPVMGQNMMIQRGPQSQMIQPNNMIPNRGIPNMGMNTNFNLPNNNNFQRPAVPQIPSLNLNMNGNNQNMLNQRINSAVQNAVSGNNDSGPKTHTINLQITRKKIVPDNNPAPPTSGVHPPLLPKHMINRRPENPKHQQALQNAIQAAPRPVMAGQNIQSQPQTGNSALTNLVSNVQPQGASNINTASLAKLLSASSAAKPQSSGAGRGTLSDLLASSSVAKPAVLPKDFTQGRLEQNLLAPAGANLVAPATITSSQPPPAKPKTISVVKTNSQLTNAPIEIVGKQNTNQKSIQIVRKQNANQKTIALAFDKTQPQVIQIDNTNSKNISAANPLSPVNGTNIPFNITTSKVNGKMEIMLMSKYTGSRPIVIEAGSGNILLSHVKTANGQTQFIIKHEKPTTTAASASTTDVPTTTITEEAGEMEAEDYPTTTLATTTSGSASVA